jgi:hypothetical protein
MTSTQRLITAASTHRVAATAIVTLAFALAAVFVPELADANPYGR